MRELTALLGDCPQEAVIIFEDNQSMISMTKNPQFHGRTKQTSIRYHFVRELVDEKAVELKYCPMEDMVTDMLTGALQKEQFVKLRLIGSTTCQ